MNLEKIIFGFFIVLALTLNVSFVVGDIDNPAHHDVIMLFLAIIVNLVATGLKLGDRSQIGALLLATSLVADLQLLAAAWSGPSPCMSRPTAWTPAPWSPSSRWPAAPWSPTWSPSPWSWSKP